MPAPSDHLPVLNWRELGVLLGAIAPTVEGLFLDRVIVPERRLFPDGFIKGEWLLRFSGRKAECGILFSVRPRRPYLALVEGKGPRAAPEGTHSAFDLAVSKHLKGARLARVQAVEKERVCILSFSENNLKLVLSLIPAVPEALLVQGEAGKPEWKVIARSRVLRDPGANGIYRLPDGARAPADPPVRIEVLETPQKWLEVIEAGLASEAFQERLRIARKKLREIAELAQERIRQSRAAAEQAGSEPDWNRYGDLLKSVMYSAPPLLEGNEREVEDFGTGARIRIPCDPKLTIQQQVEKYYQNSRRRQRRADEAKLRIERSGAVLQKIERLQAGSLQAGDWKALESLERAAGGGAPEPARVSASGKKSGEAWLGRTFFSKDGHRIWVGRSRDENLELTFKVARGNDLWFHVRGRPGAHVVIQLQPGKSAPLEALLDAATLAMFYSGGEKWGKTEVDYTFKKYVKRIKDSTEASYTHNKTLIVEPDPVRLKRLMGTEA